MNWDALQAIAEMVAAIAVLLSLWYLAAQIRNNTASVQAGTVSRVAELWDEFRRSIWTNPEVTRMYIRALSGDRLEDPVMAVQTRAYWFNLLKGAETVYFQREAGQLPEAIWNSYRRELLLYLGTPGGRDALAGFGDILSGPFQHFLQDEIDALERPPLKDLRSRWDEAADRRRSQAPSS